MKYKLVGVKDNDMEDQEIMWFISGYFSAKLNVKLSEYILKRHDKIIGSIVKWGN